jgi:hypothetical protein
MKTAILLGGPYRSQDWIMEKHYENIGMYDTFLSCREIDVEDWIKSKWNIKEIYITPEITKDELSFDRLTSNNSEQAKCILNNLYWQYKNIGNCWNNLPKEYDIYIKSRCDMVYDTKLEIGFDNIKDDEIWCPSKTFWGFQWVGNGFFNDQLYIAKENVMNFVASFYNEAHSLNNSIGIEIRKELFNNQIVETAFILWLANWDIKQKKFEYTYTKNHFGWTNMEYSRNKYK